MSNQGWGVLIILFLVAAASSTTFLIVSFVVLFLWMSAEQRRTGRVPSLTQMDDRRPVLR